MGKRQGRQNCQRRQRHAEIVHRQTEFTGMRWQTFPVICGMLDSMHPRRYLGEEQDNNEKELTQ
jgi:hypothetical protein